MMKPGAVQGHLIKWAREQRGLTLRQVQELGGPSIGFQSEVENGRKPEVSTQMLRRWVDVLSVTDTFARGLLPCCHVPTPNARGMAAEAVSLVIAANEFDWESLEPLQRVVKVLELIAAKSGRLPPVVLAHALGIELGTLENYIAGGFLPPVALITQLIELTMLPASFFETGRIEQEDVRRLYLRSVDRAVQLGITPEQFEHLIEWWGRQQPSDRPQPPNHLSDR